MLFVSFADVFRQSTMVFTEQTGLENLYSMVAYAFNLKTLVTWLNILMLRYLEALGFWFHLKHHITNGNYSSVTQ